MLLVDNYSQYLIDDMDKFNRYLINEDKYYLNYTVDIKEIYVTKEIKFENYNIEKMMIEEEIKALDKIILEEMEDRVLEQLINKYNGGVRL